MNIQSPLLVMILGPNSSIYSKMENGKCLKLKEKRKKQHDRLIYK